MIGSEKADGYSQDAFTGLDDHEKETVFKLLVTELPWSVEWLFFLDPARALVVTKELEEKLRSDSYADVYMLQQKLVKYSGDLLYQKHMIEDYANYDDDSKPLVVDAIHRTPANEATIKFFKQIVLTEVNASAVARASRHLLDAVRIARVTKSDEINYDRLVNELRSESTQVKMQAIAKIEKYEIDV